MSLEPRARARTLLPLAAFACAVGTLLAAEPGTAESFESRGSTHFRLYYNIAFEQRTGPTGSARFERDVLDSLEAAHRELRDWLDLAPRRRVDVVIHDPQSYDRSVAGRVRFASAGFYAGRVHVRGGNRMTPALEAVLAHELVHAALDQLAPAAAIPGWANEGLASWFEARIAGRGGLYAGEVRALRVAAGNGAWLPPERLRVGSFASFGPDFALLAYLQSQALIEHLGARRGNGAVREFAARLVRSGDSERALERTVGMGLTELDRSLRDALRGS